MNGVLSNSHLISVNDGYLMGIKWRIQPRYCMLNIPEEDCDIDDFIPE